MRVASLLPSGTELVCALGMRDALVGVSHECDYPCGVEQLPRLTSSILDQGLSPAGIDAAVAEAGMAKRPLYTVDASRLGELQPELLVTQGVCTVCAVSEATVEDALRLLPLELASSAQVVSLVGTSYEGVRQDVRTLGTALGREGEAEALLEDMAARWDALGQAPLERPPRVFMLEWPDPPWAAGHWVPEQVAAAGGVDIVGRPGLASERTDWAAVASADPDFIVASACGFGVQANLEHARKLLADERVASLRAVREGRFWAVDANSYFSRPAPRIVEGAELLADLLRGRTVDPARARRVEHENSG